MSIISNEAIERAQQYNETEIRFHVLDQVLRALGYPETENSYLYLEEKLEYPYFHIGRRSKKDLPLGFADYRAGVKGARGSFVVEAKAGDVPITIKEVEQAHSYAAHAQVGANFYVLCNGHVLRVYETLSGANASPIVELNLAELNDRFHELENILSPSNLTRHCHVEYDTKLKLGEGLGSFAQVKSGRYLLSDYEINIVANGQDVTSLVRQSVPQFAEAESQIELMKSAFDLRVSSGTVERDDEGKIVATLEFAGATLHNKAAMSIMGIDSANFTTPDKFISTDPESPTIFESVTDFTVSSGTSLPQLFGGEVEMENDLFGSMFIKAAMCYSDNHVVGQYVMLSDHEVSVPGQVPITLTMDVVGTFELEIGA